jgi:hypothetical protein
MSTTPIKLLAMSEEKSTASRGRHIFILFEAGASFNSKDWEALRQNVLVGGGYLSLALADGAGSNWVVRPAPCSAQIPVQVFTSGANTVLHGFAAAVIDQVLEAQAQVPGIRVTEIHLYGGALAETELHDALAGEPTIRLLVSDRGGLRKGRSTHTPSVPTVPSHATVAAPTKTASGGISQAQSHQRPSSGSKPSGGSNYRHALLAGQLQDAIAKLETELAEAKAGGNARKVTDAAEALEARKAWLKALG